MANLRRPLLAAVCSIGLLSLASPAGAVIERLTTLENLIADADMVLVAKVKKLDAERSLVVLAAEKALKGELGFERIAVNLAGQHKEASRLIADRLAVGLPLVLFISEIRGQQHMLAYTNGSWFHIVGRPDGDQVRWVLIGPEVYLRRTFKGTTSELEQAVADAIAGKREPPPPDAKTPPGLGPKASRTE